MYKGGFYLDFYERSDKLYYSWGQDAFSFTGMMTCAQWKRLRQYASGKSYKMNSNNLSATPTSGKSYKNAEQYKNTPQPISPYPTPVIGYYKKLTSC